MDKENVVYTHNGILHSHKKNETISFTATGMDLEISILSEVSQKEKTSTLMHIYGIQKNGNDEPICREGMEMKMLENGHVDTVGEGEETNGKSSINISILSNVR